MHTEKKKKIHSLSSSLEYSHRGAFYSGIYFMPTPPSSIFMKTGLFVNRHFLNPHWGCGPCLVLPGHRLLFLPPSPPP